MAAEGRMTALAGVLKNKVLTVQRSQVQKDSQQQLPKDLWEKFPRKSEKIR